MLPDEILLINDGSFLLRMMARRLEERGLSDLGDRCTRTGFGIFEQP